MSLDTSDPVDTLPTSAMPVGDLCKSDAESSQWDSLPQRLLARWDKQAIRNVLGPAARGGSIYRWGLAAASGQRCDQQSQWLSRLACLLRPPHNAVDFDLQIAVNQAIDMLSGSSYLTPVDAARAIHWAAAMPALTGHLEQATWWDLLGSLQQLRASVIGRSDLDCPLHLLLGVELGLTLAWRLSDLPSCKRLQKPSLEEFATWCKCEDDAIAGSITDATHARLALASWIRCQQIIEKTTKRKVKKQQLSVGEDLATWVAALTTYDGTTALSTATRKDVRDDLPPHGLLARATDFDRESLEPAIQAALGKSQSGGRLAWEVTLPEAFHHDQQAKIAVMFPDWDVRRGRIHWDYRTADNRFELFAGRALIISGACQSMIEIDGQPQQASGDWETVCEYTDDDVHYLEIEQKWTAGTLLQRQVVLIRDDRCVLVADTVTSAPSSGSGAPSSGSGAPSSGSGAPSVGSGTPSAGSGAAGQIRYDCRWPLAAGIEFNADDETREVFLEQAGKRRALVMPLAAAEWRVGPTNATLKETADQHLVLTAQGNGRVYSPLWFDLQARRFPRVRTWRQLTVVDALRIVDPSEAVGYRIQTGSEQWLLYRSLGESCCRSVLGKHLIADFFAARFDTGDGSLEELVTVDDNESADD